MANGSLTIIDAVCVFLENDCSVTFSIFTRKKQWCITFIVKFEVLKEKREVATVDIMPWNGDWKNKPDEVNHYMTEMCHILSVNIIFNVNPLSGNPTKLSNTHYLSLFDHFMGLVMKGLTSTSRNISTMLTL